MNTTLLLEVEFWLLIAFSFVLPPFIYWFLISRKAIAEITILVFGVALVGIAGVDVYLLQYLAAFAKLYPSALGDTLFTSEVSLALYLLPAMFGGIGINLVSHVLVTRLASAEKRFSKEHLKK